MKHISNFESLRWFAAFWVFASHILLIAEKPVRILKDGGQAVDLFVILSGFVITLMVIRRPEPCRWYIFRRFMRLYPLYLVALGMGIATEALYGPVIGASLFGGEARANFDLRADYDAATFAKHLALHLTMLHGAVPNSVLELAPLAFSGPLWSISLEWQFYLCAPLFIYALDMRQPGRWKLALPVLMGIFALCFFVRAHWDDGVPAFLPLRLPLFALGILCALYWEKAQSTSPLLLGAIGLVTAYLLPKLDFSRLPLLLWFATYVVTAGTAHRWLRPFSAAMSLRPFVWLGERSYGLYVLHMPIVLTLMAWLVVPNAARLGQAGVIASGLAIYLVVVAAAATLYAILERPAVRWAKRFEKREEPGSPPLARPAA